jgi:hypothetical protein
MLTFLCMIRDPSPGTRHSDLPGANTSVLLSVERTGDRSRRASRALRAEAAGSACEHARVRRSRGRGTARGNQPNLSAVQRKHVLSLYDAGEHTQAERAELFSVSRTTMYREIHRRGVSTMPADGPRRWSRKGSLAQVVQ